MAERRMFAKTIIDSDAFLDMSLSTQALYFHLSMRADDDGFVNNAKKIMRMIGSNDDELKILIAKNFIILFEDGVIVIKHWRLHNYIQRDRYKPTVYQEKLNTLDIKENNVYTLDTNCIQNGNTGKVRLGKVRLGKVSLELGNISGLEEVKTNFEKIFFEVWNNECNLSKLKNLSEKRKIAIKNRVEEIKIYLKKNKDITEDITTEVLSIFKFIINKINQSDFLNGINDRKWKADFDWLFSNDTNIWKVIEGKYDNKNNIVSTKNLRAMKNFLESD
jgi:hypothetical protein